MTRLLPRALIAPAVAVLLCWMLVPLLMTVYFSFVDYNLMQPGGHPFVGLRNYEFFVMPAVNALLWKHMMMNPIYGVLADLWRSLGLTPVDWLTDVPLLSVIIMVAWQWLPFACLIFITSLQSLDREQMEAARMDGATAPQRFFYLTIPHLGRPMAVVIMIEMIFLLSVFAEIAITTNGGPGNESTNLTYMIFKQSLMNFDVGVASAGALFAVVLANIVAVFLIRIVGKNLD